MWWRCFCVLKHHTIHRTHYSLDSRFKYTATPFLLAIQLGHTYSHSIIYSLLLLGPNGFCPLPRRRPFGKSHPTPLKSKTSVLLFVNHLPMVAVVVEVLEHTTPNGGIDRPSRLVGGRSMVVPIAVGFSLEQVTPSDLLRSPTTPVQARVRKP